MKLFMFALLFGQVLFNNVRAQTPVKWSFEFVDKGKTIEILAIATMEKNWNIYSQHTEDNGPIPTTFYMGEEKIVFKEKGKIIKGLDPLFEVEVIKIKEKAVFSYIYEKNNQNKIEGYVNFMCCDNEKCLPPTDVNFNFSW